MDVRLVFVGWGTAKWLLLVWNREKVRHELQRRDHMLERISGLAPSPARRTFNS